MSSEVQAVKAQLLELEAKRAAMETQVAEASARLNAPGGAGMTGSLVDKEGFPRADIDVVQARKDRHAIACLSNDHKDISRKLAILLDKYHELVRTQIGSAAPKEQAPLIPLPSSSASAAAATANGSAPASTGSNATPPAAASLPPANGSSAVAPSTGASAPFALIDEVSEDSPAALAGLQVGDQLCVFGSVRTSSASPSSSQEALQRVAAELQGCEGQALQAVVLRAGVQLTLSFTPRRWSGRGMLGCHLRLL